MRNEGLSAKLWNLAVETPHGPTAKERMEEFDELLHCALNDEWQAGCDESKEWE